MPDNIPIAIIEEDAHSLVLQTRNHFLQLREKAGLDKAWRSAEESYFNGTDDYYKGQAKVRIPALHQAVERIVPKMDKVLFPPDGEFIALSAKDPDNELEADAASAATALIKQQFIEIHAREKLIGIYRSLSTYGTVFIKTYWNHIEKEKFVRKDDKREREVFTTFDDPDFYSPSIWDIFADPKDENLEGAVIERIMMDYSDLYKLRKHKEDGEEVGIYNNIDEIKGMFFKREADDDKQLSDEIRGVGGHEYGPHENKVQLFEYWGPIPKYFLTQSWKDKESLETVDNCLIVIASTVDSNSNTNGNAVCLRIAECPFDHNEKPYLRGRYIKVDGRLYGLGVMSVSISLEAELNTLRNQLMDMRTFMLKNKWLRDKNSEISDWQLQDLSNLVIDTNDMAGLKALLPPDFSGSALASENVIKQDIYDATGATPLLSGTPSGSSLDRTAAGIATVVSGGLERFELVITLFSEEILKRLVERFWQLNQQFLPEGRDVRLIGRPLIQVIPEEIPFNFELNFLGTREIGEKEFKINALNILLQNLAPYIPLGLDPIPVVLKFFKLTGMGELEKEVDMRPNSQLENTPEGELQLLQMGRKVRIDLNDDHDKYIAAYITLLKQPNLPDNVVSNTKEALGQRVMAKKMLSEIQRQLGTAQVQTEPTEETGETTY